MFFKTTCISKFFLICGLLFSSHILAADLRIAAATNLRYVLPDLVASFENFSGHKLSVSYAASGTLATQIMHGAPFQVLLSANPSYIQHLQDNDFASEQAITFAYGQLALFSASHAMFDVVKGIASIETALDQNMLKKVAIANPKHAPYGQAAQKQLEKFGLWEDIQSHLLVAENASQATQFTLSSRSSVGFIPYTHAIQPAIKQKGEFIKLDALLPQQAVAIEPVTATAQAFIQFLKSKPAVEILSQQGFVIEQVN